MKTSHEYAFAITYTTNNLVEIIILCIGIMS